MTTLDEAQIAALALLDTLPETNPYPFIPDSPDFPAIFFNPVPAIDYWDSAAEDSLHLLELILLGSAALDENLSQLVPYLERAGDFSIFRLFQENRSLGFTDVDAYIREARPLDVQEAAGYRGYGASLVLVVSLGP